MLIHFLYLNILADFANTNVTEVVGQRSKMLRSATVGPPVIVNWDGNSSVIDPPDEIRRLLHRKNFSAAHRY